MISPSDIIACFGAAHWDQIGKALPGTAGPDRPGLIRVAPGGVAANVALALAGAGMPVELLTALGADEAGTRLLSNLRARGVGTSGVIISTTLPTGRYMAVEDDTGELVAAVADCRVVEALTPQSFDLNRRRNAARWFVETNLPAPVIAHLAAIDGHPPLIANPVSPARADGLRPILDRIDTLYCNRLEAEVLSGATYATSADAATALLRQGVGRAVVTDGPRAVCDASSAGLVSADPATEGFTSATGAGDAFLARHLAAVLAGADPQAALHVALTAKVLPQEGVLD